MTDFFGKRGRRPWIIGHRGAMGHAPENTPASFELGWKLGADALECDVHLSKDRELVVIHDETLDRTTSGTGFVGQAPWRRIRGLDAGGWYDRRFRGQRVWRLPDLLAWIRGKTSRAGEPLRLIIEIKNEPVRYAGIADRVAAAIRKSGLENRVGVISFDHGAVKRVKILLPHLFTGLLLSRSLPDTVSRARWTRADALFPRYTLVSPALMRLAKKHKLFVGTWTVNELADLNKMVRLRVEAIATNFPDRLAKVLGVRP